MNILTRDADDMTPMQVVDEFQVYVRWLVVFIKLHAIHWNLFCPSHNALAHTTVKRMKQHSYSRFWTIPLGLRNAPSFLPSARL